MDDKNEVVFVGRDKLQSRKKHFAVMHNNFVNKTLNYARRAQLNAEWFWFLDRMKASDLILAVLLRNFLCTLIHLQNF